MSQHEDKKDPSGSVLNLDVRLLAQIQTARIEIIFTICLGALSGIVLVVQAWLLSEIISQVFLESAGLPDVATYLVFLLALAIVKSGLTWASNVTAGRGAGRVKKSLREKLAGHLVRLGPTFIHQEHTGDITNTITEGVEALHAYVADYLPQVALAGLVPLTVLAVVFPLDPLTGVILLVTAPIIPVFMWLIGSLARSVTEKQWSQMSRFSAHFLDILQGLATLKALGQSSAEANDVAKVADQYRQTTMNVLRVTFLSALVLEMAATISTAVIAVQVGLRLLDGNLVFQQAFFILLLAPEFYQPLRKLGSSFHAGIKGVTAAGSIFDLLDKPAPAIRVESTPGEITVPKGDIVFSDVFFAYDEGKRPALNDLSLQIRAGSCLALVGPSGAGKSTVAHLLLRFIEPDRGEITIDGVRLQDIPLPAWREQVAWVSQNPYLMNGTIHENIALGLKDSQQNDRLAGVENDRIVQAAKQAHAHEFIESLPQGYQTAIGERGAQLSGGQAQRIALARAFIKDSPIIIMDEATANLDSEQENMIQDSLEALFAGRTVLVIAHRLNTIVNAGRIVVVAGGRLMETGTYHELVQRDGLFSRLDRAFVYGERPDWQDLLQVQP